MHGDSGWAHHICRRVFLVVYFAVRFGSVLLERCLGHLSAVAPVVGITGLLFFFFSFSYVYVGWCELIDALSLLVAL